MQIKKIYLDLKEAKPEKRFGNDVRVLESEAFKDPLTLQVEYDSKDTQRLQETEEKINQRIEKLQQILDQEHAYAANLEKENSLLKQQLLFQEQNTQRLQEQLSSERYGKDRLSEEVKMQAGRIDSMKQTITAVNESVEKINKKLTVQPRVISDSTFVSGAGESFLTLVNIPDGEYILIQQTKVAEKNEYVTNEDELTINKIHIQNGTYTPSYTLRATDAISIPTATIDRTLTFIPC